MGHGRSLADRLRIALPAAAWAWSQAVSALTGSPTPGTEALDLIPARELGRLPRLPRVVPRAEMFSGPPLRLKAARALAPDVAREYATQGPEPIRLAQAPGQRLSQFGNLAPGQASRNGDGASALTGVAPENAPRTRRNRAAASPVTGADSGAGETVESGSASPGNGKRGRNREGGSRFSRWGIAPIRWGGDLMLELRSQSNQGQPSRQSMYEGIGFRAGSYIWQPWFAQVNGGLRLMQTQDGLGGKGGETGIAGTKSTSVTGNGALLLFPVSRFPFTASYDVSDSRASGELTSSNYLSRRLGLRQSYMPFDSKSSYLISYDRSAIESSSFGGTDVAQSLSFAASRYSGPHNFSFSGNRYDNTTHAGDTSNLTRYQFNHGYRPQARLSVDSFANYSVSDYRVGSTGIAPTDSQSRFLQLNTFGSWQPADNSPLRVTGGGRLFQTRAETNGSGMTSNSIGANGAVSYSLNRNILLTGGGTVDQVESGGRHTLATTLNGGANYTSDVLSLGEYKYGWNGGANASTQNLRVSGDDTTGASRTVASNNASRHTLNTRVGHHISRIFPLDEASAMTVNGGQAISILGDSAYPLSRNVVHNGGLTWTRRGGESASNLVGLTAMDSRTTGFNPQHFQLVNLQGNGQYQTSRFAFLNANLTVQAVRRDASRTNSTATSGQATIVPATMNTSTGGSVSYQHMRAFGVPQLRYVAQYNINQFQYRTRLEGDINAPVERISQAFEQRFDYNVGRIEMRLSMRVATIEGRTNGLIFLRIVRQFGAY